MNSLKQPNRKSPSFPPSPHIFLQPNESSRVLHAQPERTKPKGITNHKNNPQNNTMKTTRLLLTGIVATLACSMTAYAEGDGPSNGDKKGKGKKGNREVPEHVIKKFDKDGDGKLNEEERKAAREARTKMQKEGKAKMLKRFDKDGDGKLSDEERKTARETMQKQRKEMHEAMLKKFDANGNGEIDKDERDGIREWIRENYPDAPMMRHGKKGGRGKKGKKGKKDGKRGGDGPPAAE